MRLGAQLRLFIQDQAYSLSYTTHTTQKPALALLHVGPHMLFPPFLTFHFLHAAPASTLLAYLPIYGFT